MGRCERSNFLVETIVKRCSDYTPKSNKIRVVQRNVGNTRDVSQVARQRSRSPSPSPAPSVRSNSPPQPSRSEPRSESERLKALHELLLRHAQQHAGTSARHRMVADLLARMGHPTLPPPPSAKSNRLDRTISKIVVNRDLFNVKESNRRRAHPKPPARKISKRMQKLGREIDDCLVETNTPNKTRVLTACKNKAEKKMARKLARNPFK